MIIDEVEIQIEAGAGGNGCISFRREKYVPRGGPNGGNGGRGGDVLLEARTDVSTLVDFLYHPLFRAKHGEHGKGKNMHGKDSPHITIRVPIGTLVKDQNQNVVVDMDHEGMIFLIAKGGRGGRGNATFATSTQQAPRLAEKGEPGEIKTLHLELKLLADVGIVGFPNAGKSTLLSRITHATPKIADYPFTTLEPQLGVVELSESRSFVLADVPGLIEGASSGKGLGIRFLKHLERTRLLLHLVDLSNVTTLKELETRIKIINRELKGHSPQFLKMPQILVLTKTDAALPVYKTWLRKLQEKGNRVVAISAVTGQGLKDLLEATWGLLTEIKNEISKNEKNTIEEVYYRPKSRFEIKKSRGSFRVDGAEIKKWVAMTNFDNRDALERFDHILKRMGVMRELKKLGLKDGDTIFFDDQEMSYDSESLGAKSGE